MTALLSMHAGHPSDFPTIHSTDLSQDMDTTTTTAAPGGAVDLPTPASPPAHDDHHHHRGRRRDRDEADDDGDENGDDQPGSSRKRRRSRKSGDKKFLCPHEGCGKSYSRAEHLYRHQLNRMSFSRLPFSVSRQQTSEPYSTLHAKGKKNRSNSISLGPLQTKQQQPRHLLIGDKDASFA